MNSSRFVFPVFALANRFPRRVQRPPGGIHLVPFTLLVPLTLLLAATLTAADTTNAAAQYAQLPLDFEANLGQTDSRVGFVARSAGYTMFLLPSEAVMVLRQSALRMTIDGGSPTAAGTPLDRQPGISAYFIGNDPSRWLPEVPHYAR